MPRQQSPSSSKSPVGDLLRVGPDFRLDRFDAAAVIAGPDDKHDACEQSLALEEEVTDLHERLWAEAKHGAQRSLLVVLQGMDTAGKGGATKAIDRLVDPLGFSVVGFGPPSDEERRHPYLWRHERALPAPGSIRLWDRSHYEEVLVVRVHGLVPPSIWAARYDEINDWEQRVAEQGVTMLKCMLHISADEQQQRFVDRLTDPTKHWKYNPGDIDERARWGDYQAAFQDLLVRCSTEVSPWYVIPANRKWHRDWLLSQLLAETLRAMDLRYPPADFDVEAELERARRA